MLKWVMEGLYSYDLCVKTILTLPTVSISLFKGGVTADPFSVF